MNADNLTLSNEKFIIFSYLLEQAKEAYMEHQHRAGMLQTFVNREALAMGLNPVEYSINPDTGEFSPKPQQ